MWGNQSGSASEGLFGSGVVRKVIGPVLMGIFSTGFIPVVVMANLDHDGSLLAAGTLALTDPVSFFSAWFTLPSWTAVRILLAWSAFQLALMRLVPGKTFRGPVTPAGNVPVYTANGFQCFIITLVTYLLAGHYFHVFDPAIVYDNYKDIIAGLNIFSLAFCVVLLLKGLYAPSSTDSGTTGSVVMDYYWGTELYPRILGWDVKVFTNCRFGMMAWAILPLAFAAKSQQLHGHVSPALMVNMALQLIYCSKFFLWETGYLASMDIMHDRAGYYLCWGCLCWVPSVYVSHSLFLVNHSLDLSPAVAAAIFAAGYVCICINYDADRQRAHARATRGDCVIWGAKPRMIEAEYRTETGERKTSLLLVSGWWSVSRHFHYLPEMAAAFFWSAPAGASHFLPYFYLAFLAPLLFDRAFRDDKRCAAKYGKHWKTYCAAVPWKVIPYVV